MIGLDTNVIVRYLTQDDRVQSALATEVFERRLTQAIPGFISVVALVETCWVLERIYDASSSDIVRAIEGLLGSDTIVVDREAEVYVAAVAVANGAGSFADVLIAQIGVRAGCSTTVTFDRAAARSTGFTALDRGWLG
ncbi:MAG: PIN domain-containing protein [Vulcanimicrobiaceae bacterium]